MTEYTYLLLRGSKKVRKAIADIGGTMPEDLPTQKKILKQLEKENKRSLKKQNK
ncbi:MAG: hypothetical protein ACI4VP_03710 [Clostridia bacterium]